MEVFPVSSDTVRQESTETVTTVPRNTSPRGV